MRIFKWLVALLISAFVSVASAQPVTLTMWSHWAAEKVKRSFVEDAIQRFEADHPDVKIKIVFYERPALYAALKTALRAGTAPDLFYAEPDQVEYMDDDLLLDLSSLNWSGVEPWAKAAWTYKGKPYGLPLEAWSVELYYNKKLLKELELTVPDGTHQLTTEQFGELIKKARARDITPMSLGAGDRPYPGAFLVHEALLKKLGISAYNNLLGGTLSWADPRVVSTLKLVRSWVDAGLLPTTFTTLKLGESHTYFYSKPGAVTFLGGSFYPSRAFNPPDKGGQPAEFPLGIMNYPAIPDAACNQCKTIAVGGSYAINASTKHPKEALAFLNSLISPAVADRWLEQVVGQTGIKADLSKLTGPHTAYLKDLFATNTGVEYAFGLPLQKMEGKPREVFTQIFNNAFPAGTISVDKAVAQMNAAYKQ